MNLEALFDAVIVKPLEEEETMYGNIVVPDLGKEKNEKGTVVSVGPGKPSVTGDHFFETKIKVGDVVVLPTMGFTKLEHEGEEYFVGPEQQILAKVNSSMEATIDLAEPQLVLNRSRSIRTNRTI